MRLLTNILWLPLMLQICSYLDNVSGDDQLIAAHVIHRHGDRNICKAYPKDPHKSKRKWPGGFGALTGEGQQQTYELGRFLRRRYYRLIGSHYSPDKMFYRSTNRSRTIKSAKSCSAGLYDRQSRLPHIHTVHVHQDYLLSPSAKCPRVHKLMDEYFETRTAVDIWKKHSSLIKYIGKKSGKRLRSFKDVFYIYDTLYVEDLKGLKLPTWAKNVLKSRRTLEYLTGVYLEAFTHTTELKQLKAGYLLDEILDHFYNKIQSRLSPDRNLWIYSAHDVTIAIFLNALNLYDMKIPPYASSVHIELYRHGSMYYVQVLFRKSAQDEYPQPLDIPHCGTKCPLDTFYDLYKNILPNKSFASACKVSK